MESKASALAVAPGNQSFAELVETADGAAWVRIWLGCVVLVAYLIPHGHREQAWSAIEVLLAINIPLLALCLFIPPASLIYHLGFALLRLLAWAVDAASFKVPRWLLRKRMRPLPAFWSAVAIQIALLGMGVGYVRHDLAVDAELHRPVAFGPAVIRRLHLKSNRALAYREGNNGQVLPAISPNESLRRHRTQAGRTGLASANRSTTNQGQ